MIKYFIFTKLSETLFKKVMQGDKRGLMRYLKIAIIAVFILVVLLIVGIVLLVQFLLGLFTHMGTQAELVKNVSDIQIEESIEKVREVVPKEVTTMVEQAKTNITPYETLLQEGEGALVKINEIIRRFENLIP